MLNYSSTLELEVSWFKFILDGHCISIMEDETVSQLHMENSDTINVVFNQRVALGLLYHCYSIKGLLLGITLRG